MEAITRDSQYVPHATLKRWSEDGIRVWAYRMRVSHLMFRNAPPRGPWPRARCRNSGHASGLPLARVSCPQSCVDPYSARHATCTWLAHELEDSDTFLAPLPTVGSGQVWL